MQIMGANIAGMSEAARVYQSQAGGAAKLQKGSAPNRFDSIMLSRSGGTRSAYEMELRSSISRDVRTATSVGQVAQLREQVRSGTYEVDAREIAKKMLLLGGVG